MKAAKRVLLKVIILLLVAGIAGGGAASWQAYRQSTAEYAMDHYLSMLIDNRTDKAYAFLDRSEGTALTLEEYTAALEAKKYSLYASYDLTEQEKRRDNNGNEYTDYLVKFKNAADEVQTEETFTVKKQSAQVLGLFDQWRVLSAHCMVQNFKLTVPAGSTVYLNAVQADKTWITSEGTDTSKDCYQIPTLIPGQTGLVIRHPAFESVNATLDVENGDVDYTGKMTLGEAAKASCTELGVSLLKAVYSSAAMESDSTDKSEAELLKACESKASELIQEQRGIFHSEDAVFKNVAISDFVTKFEDPVFTNESGGAITTQMTFSYHYVVREDVTTQTEELQEDGTPVEQTETQEQSGDATAQLTMSYEQDAWHIVDMEMNSIPEKK